jgi:hypothetical protein
MTAPTVPPSLGGDPPPLAEEATAALSDAERTLPPGELTPLLRATGASTSMPTPVELAIL